MLLSYQDDVIDSYSEFARGVYEAVTLGCRYHRVIGAAPRTVTNPDGTVITVNETIDGSVFDRWRYFDGYRPTSLKRWAKERTRNPEQIFGLAMA